MSVSWSSVGSGFHGDVWGGRKDDALAHLALAWMMAKLYSSGILDFNKNLFWKDEGLKSSWRLDSSGGKYGPKAWSFSNTTYVERIKKKAQLSMSQTQ